ncbi:16S rRNA (guanine(966)-N(2))-methyltransferase RsmD [Spiribacter vilamensis]|uniref:Ribosomal RNA small subunit methyltransferase D n=1 Tax=Spiribacter vilamensis TaxID=531306 RepID=A0A4V2GJ80_9GAMM|nr:16S rRNA (guanine(966)-N(2))-methyltransferase RsmD [Spiribacter vilamensis]RZU99315.1 16S rRNA (guanine966-N2)-methyltransferase [Spiribacter vilamensis]TVO61701.1 16S rRNA (guanine(966)-N(2))-methyltransferase RsmD [Spiribacter vilamensis]
MSGQLRIIGGDWRGRRLRVGAAPGLRPTADRNRETLFNWLQSDVAGARILDLFAGTGALGLEALSRGAVAATFVERSRPVARALSDLIDRLEASDRARVVTADARRYLRADPATFDLVFLDPPFDSHLLADSLERLRQGGWLSADAQVYIESRDRRRPPLDPAVWECEREKTAGDVWFALLRPSR